MEPEDSDKQIKFERLDAFGQSLVKTRAEAISGRGSSNIEEIWREDEEFYEGVDDANRSSESRTNWRQKPPGQTSGLKKKTTRSTVFPNITGPFVDAAAARIADMLLPTDDRSWGLKPTPIPELISLSKGEISPDVQQQIATAYPDNPEAANAEGMRVVEAAEQEMAAARKKADAAQTRIEDWHVECQWHAQVRTVIEDSARIGTGVLKGPVPQIKKRVVWQNGQMQMVGETKPGSKWTDPWNFYPDPACGENIHNGSFTWERDFLTKKQLRELKGGEGYIKEQIDRCLNEGPQTATGEFKETPDPVIDVEMKGKYEVWYFHGTAEKEDLETAGCDCEEADDPHVPAMVTIVNNHVIRASLNPLDTGEFPYDVMVWRRRSGHWTGIGVARQIRVPQKIVTGGTRNLMDNAGVAAGPMIVFRQGAITPADGVAGIAPRKVFYITEDEGLITDATKAIGVIKVDMLVNDLLQIIQLGMTLAEKTTGLPMLLQGQMGQSTPDTLGGQEMFMNNASTVLRRLAKLFDDRITEPHVRRYYAWLLQYGEDSEKGDYSIDARGSSALVERDIQNKELGAMANIALDPRFGLDPKKWVQEYLKSRRFDPKRFEFDDDQWKQIVEQMSQQPQDMSMAVAQFRAQVDEKLKAIEQQGKENIQAAKLQHEADQNERDRELKLLIENMGQEVEVMRQGGSKDVNLDTIKAKLAEIAMKLRTQEKLAGRMQVVKPVITPPTEPLGKARAGKAFEA